MDTKDKVLWYVLGALTGWLVIALVVTFGGAALSVMIGLMAVIWPLLLVAAIVGVVLFIYDHKK